ncbi:hypothetical protein PSTG_10396 [Puccinia striiformis f. sp. tritici PST-78]|uniref:Uncharacterized protein n=1 Tax=Puccinia striiformis f. sp. tritici PST-78 TaxID=1165861 RepID=A0A0L0VAN1_9BASI|nr:hypothetical protein PSTG_10396 [Puccinia striiformis f. sp. tritici PST-78]
MGPFPEYVASVHFRPVQAQAITHNIDLIAADKTMNTKLIGRVIGGQMLCGQVDYLAQSILDWFGGKFYQSFVQDQEAHLLFVEQLREERKAYLLQHKIDMALQASEKRQKNTAAKAEGKKHAAEEGLGLMDDGLGIMGYGL